jgi:hypothetical protein
MVTLVKTELVFAIRMQQSLDCSEGIWPPAAHSVWLKHFKWHREICDLSQRRAQLQSAIARNIA